MTDVVVFASGVVGAKITSWLCEHHVADLRLIVTNGKDEISDIADEHGIACLQWTTDEAYLTRISQFGSLTIGLLLWWPRIVSPSVLGSTICGFINTHPSLLPHNRGKHYNFWAIVEQVPFGVSLHMVEPGIDCGSIVAQTVINYGWEDTGATLYALAQNQMVELFKATYVNIRDGELAITPQDLSKGSFHYASEITAASKIDLDTPTTAREILNRLRAKTFVGHPACWFVENHETYEIRVEIRKIADAPG